MNNSECHLDGYWCPCCARIRIGPEAACDHDELEQITSSQPGINEPELETILSAIFGISATELEVCLCVMDAGDATIEEIATELNVNRTTVSQHIDHLVDIGVLETDERILRAGGRVTLYTSASPEVVRTRFRHGLCHWMTEAVCQVDNLTEEKVREIGDIWTQRENEAVDTSTNSIFYSHELPDDEI